MTSTAAVGDHEPMARSGPPGRADRPGSVRGTVLCLGAWAALLVVSRLWGLKVVADAPESIFVDAVPFFGRWDLLISWRWILAVGVAVVAVVVLPRMVERLSWWRLLVVVAAAAAIWTLALAFVEPSAIAWRNIYGDYGQFVPLVEQSGPGGFLRDYVAVQLELPTHLSAHPPGMMILLWALAQVGLAGMGVDTALAVIGVAAAAVAVIVALRNLAGETRARAAAPFVVLAPAAVWHTNADVVFAGFLLVGFCLFVVATSRHDRRGDLFASAGGALMGTAVFMTYGVTLFALPVLVVAVARRRVRPVLFGGLAALAVVLLPLAWGFWWLDGLYATKEAYDRNLARVRPYEYFLVANLAAFAVAVGPAIAVALSRLRDRRTWLLVGAGLGVVALADLSGLSSAETERIWQPFMPIVLLAGCALVPAGQFVRSRPWLAAQAGVALVLVAALRSPW